jgi:hypothetical protein
MELADALSTPSSQPTRQRAMRGSDGWYDPDSVAFAERELRATGSLTRISDARRREIAAALPRGLRPLSLLVRVRHDTVSSR